MPNLGAFNTKPRPSSQTAPEKLLDQQNLLGLASPDHNPDIKSMNTDEIKISQGSEEETTPVNPFLGAEEPSKQVWQGVQKIAMGDFVSPAQMLVMNSKKEEENGDNQDKALTPKKTPERRRSAKKISDLISMFETPMDDETKKLLEEESKKKSKEELLKQQQQLKEKEDEEKKLKEQKEKEEEENKKSKKITSNPGKIFTIKKKVVDTDNENEESPKTKKSNLDNKPPLLEKISIKMLPSEIETPKLHSLPEEDKINPNKKSENIFN